MPAHHPARILRQGFTLLEVMIASGIMVILVTSLLSAWSSSMDFAFMVNQNLQRMTALDAVRNTIAADFRQSAQLIPYDNTLMLAGTNPVTNANSYPRVLQGGREIRFARFRTTVSAATSPLVEGSYTENLLGINAQPLSQFATAPVSPYFVINPASGTPGNWNIAPVWESNRSGLTFCENCGTDPATNNSVPTNYLRFYRYVLIPYSAGAIPTSLPDATTWATSAYPAYPEVGTTIRRGILLRQYCNAQSTTWNTLGTALSDAVVFDVNNAEYPTAPLPCFIFATSFDGVSRTGVEDLADNEVRLKMTYAQAVKNAAPVSYDLRFSFPFQRVDFGE